MSKVSNLILLISFIYLTKQSLDDTTQDKHLHKIAHTLEKNGVKVEHVVDCNNEKAHVDRYFDATVQSFSQQEFELGYLQFNTILTRIMELCEIKNPKNIVIESVSSSRDLDNYLQINQDKIAQIKNLFENDKKCEGFQALTTFQLNFHQKESENENADQETEQNRNLKLFLKGFFYQEKINDSLNECVNDFAEINESITNTIMNLQVLKDQLLIPKYLSKIIRYIQITFDSCIMMDQSLQQYKVNATPIIKGSIISVSEDYLPQINEIVDKYYPNGFFVGQSEFVNFGKFLRTFYDEFLNKQPFQ